MPNDKGSTDAIKRLWQRLFGVDPSAAEINLCWRAIRYFDPSDPLFIICAILTHILLRDANDIAVELIDKGPSALKYAREMADELEAVRRQMQRVHVAAATIDIELTGIYYAHEDRLSAARSWWRSLATRVSKRHPLAVITSMVFASSLFGALIAISVFAYAFGAPYALQAGPERLVTNVPFRSNIHQSQATTNEADGAIQDFQTMRRQKP